MRALILAAAILLSGCATAASPTQPATLSEAEQAATLAEQTIDVYVTSGKASPAVVAELKLLVPPIHAALVSAEASNKAGDAAGVTTGLAAFNEALAAYEAYSAAQGVQ